MPKPVWVVGGGLAGTEAAWQIANSGYDVILYEMRPGRMTPAHTTAFLGELVCSNSLKANNLENASGLLKEELRRLGSLLMTVAEETKVPAGGALAVDRHRFAAGITARINEHPVSKWCGRKSPRSLPINRRWWPPVPLLPAALRLAPATIW